MPFLRLWLAREKRSKENLAERRTPEDMQPKGETKSVRSDWRDSRSVSPGARSRNLE